MINWHFGQAIASIQASKEKLRQPKKVGGIALVPSLSELMRDQKKALVWESGKIILKSVPKESIKEVSTGRSFLHTNSDICGLKKGVTPGKKILKREADTNMAKNKATPIRNLAELLLHVLPNAYEY